MKQDRFEVLKKISLIVSLLLGFAFLALGIAQVFLSTGDDMGKLNLCLFALEALLGLTIVFFGYCVNSFFHRFSDFEEEHKKPRDEEEGL